jgi:hypothetical protein
VENREVSCLNPDADYRSLASDFSLYYFVQCKSYHCNYHFIAMMVIQICYCHDNSCSKCIL